MKRNMRGDDARKACPDIQLVQASCVCGNALYLIPFGTWRGNHTRPVPSKRGCMRGVSACVAVSRSPPHKAWCSLDLHSSPAPDCTCRCPPPKADLTLYHNDGKKARQAFICFTQPDAATAGAHRARQG